MWNKKRRVNSINNLWEDKKAYGKGFHDKLFLEENKNRVNKLFMESCDKKIEESDDEMKIKDELESEEVKDDKESENIVDEEEKENDESEEEEPMDEAGIRDKIRERNLNLAKQKLSKMTDEEKNELLMDIISGVASGKLKEVISGLVSKISNMKAGVKGLQLSGDEEDIVDEENKDDESEEDEPEEAKSDNDKKESDEEMDEGIASTQETIDKVVRALGQNPIDGFTDLIDMIMSKLSTNQISKIISLKKTDTPEDERKAKIKEMIRQGKAIRKEVQKKQKEKMNMGDEEDNIEERKFDDDGMPLKESKKKMEDMTPEQRAVAASNKKKIKNEGSEPKWLTDGSDPERKNSSSPAAKQEIMKLANQGKTVSEIMDYMINQFGHEVFGDAYYDLVKSGKISDPEIQTEEIDKLSEDEVLQEFAVSFKPTGSYVIVKDSDNERQRGSWFIGKLNDSEVKLVSKVLKQKSTGRAEWKLFGITMADENFKNEIKKPLGKSI